MRVLLTNSKMYYFCEEIKEKREESIDTYNFLKKIKKNKRVFIFIQRSIYHILLRISKLKLVVDFILTDTTYVNLLRI